MSTTAFNRLERERLDDEDATEALRIERLKHAGKLCDKCWGIDIERKSATFFCVNCGAEWLA